MKVKGKDTFTRQLAALPGAIKAEIHKALEVSAEETTDVMRRFAPAKSGKLRASIGHTFEGAAPKGAMTTAGNARSAKADAGLSVAMYAGGKEAWYARLVEFGTAPHEIRPKEPGGGLKVNGKVVEVVHHPGATAQPFFYPGYRFGRKRAKARLSRAIRNGAKKAFGK